MAYVDTLNKNSTDYALSAFGNVFINNQNSNTAKTIDYSNRGFSETDDVNLTVKVVFQNGHISADALTNMTLNGKAILVNKNGTLTPIPIQTLTEGGVTVYRTLQANTTLEMYYTKNVSGYTNGAYVVIGNPVVISTANYTIYADGYFEGEKQYPIGSIYQNKTDNRNPNTIFGFGNWIQINDVFLCGIGNTLTNLWAGNFNYTLSENNIPQHNHGGGTGGATANITSASSVEHTHYFNATHKHDVDDPSHTHTLGWDNTTTIPGNIPYVNLTNTNGLAPITGNDTKYYTGAVAQPARTYVTVKEQTVIGNTGVQSESGVTITQNNHSHTIGNYGSATPNAINTTPPYLAVYTWYRDS